MDNPSEAAGPVEVFFDGECPLCMREIKMLRRLDGGANKIRFTDIAAPDFNANHYGRDMATFMGSIQGRDEHGNWIEGVEVFRALYGAVGFGVPVRLSRLPVVREVLDAAYGFFSRNRLRLTGRSAVSCDDDRCAPAASKS